LASVKTRARHLVVVVVVDRQIGKVMAAVAEVMEVMVEVVHSAIG
jgi:hypothetical protein